jgi:N-acetylmuramic acid 6-phosphate (MurNAc-6-P) etherase
MRKRTRAQHMVAWALLGMLVSCATTGTTPRVTNTVLTKTADLVTARRVPTAVFSPEDSVVCYVYFQWDDATKEAGHHAVEWRWYQDDRLVSRSQKRLHFKRTPYTIWTQRSAGALGAGHFSVATVVDGAVVSTSNFEIRP